jgi:sterol desaturase/sphingolipid hydroxylase (fatty acid hydroxylase superfamily)
MDEARFQIYKSAAFALSLAAVFTIQSLSPYRHAPGRLPRNWRQNVPIALINAVVMGLICTGCLCTAARFAEARGLGLFRLFEVPGWVAVAGTILVLDLVVWTWHLANHRRAFLWRFHRVHHSDMEFDVSTSLRFHAGELLMSLPPRMTVVVLLGAPVAGLLAFEIGFGLCNQFVHGNIRLPVSWERRLARVIVLPAHHRLHHSSNQRDRNRNFGTILSLWDRLFGTWNGGSSADEVTTGLAELTRTGALSLRRCLLLPFERRPSLTVARDAE